VISLPRPGRAKLSAHDLRGRKTLVLLDADLGRGTYRIPLGSRLREGPCILRLDYSGTRIDLGPLLDLPLSAGL
jgi:hypothetical protein